MLIDCTYNMSQMAIIFLKSKPIEVQNRLVFFAFLKQNQILCVLKWDIYHMFACLSVPEFFQKEKAPSDSIAP